MVDQLNSLSAMVDDLFEDQLKWSRSLKERLGGGATLFMSGNAEIEELLPSLDDVARLNGQIKFRAALMQLEGAAEKDIAERFAERQQEINERALERNREAKNLSERAGVVKEWAKETKENMGKALDDIGNAVGGGD